MNVAEKDMLLFAENLLRSAGSELIIRRRQPQFKVWEKTSQMDLVTEHDLAIEKVLVAGIINRYPSHGILAEEGSVGLNADFGGYTWVIDPIDGTVNFYRFGKDYAISLALYRDDIPIFGFIYDVANGVMFSAGHGEGAMINGSCLNQQQGCNKGLKDAVVSISLRTIQEFIGMGVDVLGMLSKVQAHRYLGCASLELCKVANAEYDLFISSNVYEWDVAAARIYLKERGGVCLQQRKGYNASSDKLLVAAYRSQQLWQEVLEYIPCNIQHRLLGKTASHFTKGKEKKFGVLSSKS